MDRNERKVNTTEAGKAKTIQVKKGITGSTLKIIALIAMLIDHIAAIILDNLLLSRGLAEIDPSNTNAIVEFMKVNGGLYYLDLAMRMIGRIGFPIFCFLLVEGFIHTRNVKKYAFNLGIFALISEIPFNVAFTKNPWDVTYQNVFFTLFLGLMVMIGFKYISEKFQDRNDLSMILNFLVLMAGMTLAFFLKTDYSYMGVATIAVMYWFRKNKMAAGAAGCATLCLMSVAEIPVVLSLVPIYLYNGKRGWNMKYLFYMFYPAHILILYGIAVVMKLV